MVELGILQLNLMCYWFCASAFSCSLITCKIGWGWCWVVELHVIFFAISGYSVDFSYSLYSLPPDFWKKRFVSSLFVSNSASLPVLLNGWLTRCSLFCPEVILLSTASPRNVQSYCFTVMFCSFHFCPCKGCQWFGLDQYILVIMVSFPGKGPSTYRTPSLWQVLYGQCSIVKVCFPHVSPFGQPNCSCTARRDVAG